MAAAVVTGAALLRDEADPALERRAAVAGYIAEINMTQQVLAAQLERVREAYAELRLTTRADPRRSARVEAAVATLVDLRARIASLAAPAEARRLRAALLGLVDVQLGLAREVAGMAAYLPAQGTANRRLTAASRRLLGRIRAASTAAAQQDALARYRQVLEQAAATLRRTPAPQVLAPVRTGELARLERLAGLVDRLDEALENGDPAEIDLLFRRFLQASTDTGTTPARRRAVVAFNRRIADITSRRTKLGAELRRLDIVLR